MNAKNPAIERLNDLIQINIDGAEGYTLAAEKVEDGPLKDRFQQYASERKTFASQLTSEVVSLGGEPATGGNVAAGAHRGWMRLREAVTDSQKAIITECERGEEHAVKAYKEATADALPPRVRSLVAHQKERVQRAHDHMRGLEAVVKA